jgi:hypothetical protein
MLVTAMKMVLLGSIQPEIESSPIMTGMIPTFLIYSNLTLKQKKS